MQNIVISPNSMLTGDTRMDLDQESNAHTFVFIFRAIVKSLSTSNHKFDD